MTSVFLSYGREDSQRARSIARALEKCGHSVWWDRRIHAGSQFSKEIEEALEHAEAVVVLWSGRSIESPWVRDEAAAGRDTGRLLPILLDKSQPPLGFRQFQAIDFSSWKGRRNDARFTELTAAIATHDRGLEPRDLHWARPGRTAFFRPLPSIGRRAAFGIFILVLLIGAGIAWLALRPSASVPILAVTADEPKAASDALARDLLVKLGELQLVAGGSLQLIGANASEDDSRQPTLLLKVGDVSSNGTSQANLMLFDGRDRSLMWSRSFARPVSRVADMKQQLAFTAARVIACAVEGQSTNQQRLSVPLLKKYLNGCAALADLSGSDVVSVIRAMTEITRQAPEFTPAWAALLLAESESARPETNEGEVDTAIIRALRQHIAEARKIDPDIPELALAELAMLPRSNFGRAMALMDRANETNPDNPVLLSYRSGVLQSVGRCREAIKDARRAAELDPISPYTQYGLISALAYGGQVEAAKAELSRAERLWPGTASLSETQYRFHLRFGDPRVALSTIEAEDRGRGADIYLRTRLDPSPDNIQRLTDYVRERIKVVRLGGLAFLVQAYGEFGKTEELYAQLLGWSVPEELAIVADTYFRPGLKEARNDRRFIRLAKRSGLLAYWVTSGNWPDFCSDPALPYDCKKEAARLAA